MKLLLQLVLAIALLFVLCWALYAVLGLFVWVIVAGGIAAIIIAAIKSLIGKRQKEGAPNLRDSRRADKEAERALKDLERKVNRS
jgi:hypothetical protein